MSAVRFPLLQDQEWLQAQADAGRTMTAVARELGCTHGNVVLAAHRLSVQFAGRGAANTRRHAAARASQWPQLDDRDWLYDQHKTQGKSLVAIAALLGCSIRPVVNALKRHGIAANDSGRGPNRTRTLVRKRTFPLLEDRGWMRSQIEAGKSLDDMAAAAGCSAATVGRALSDAGIERPGAGRPVGTRSTEYPQLMNKDWLSAEYVGKDRTAQDMADEVGCTVWAMQAALGRFRILKFAERPQGKQDASLPVGTIRKDGYLLVFKPDHPNANGKGYVPQHRLICEEVLGRLLTPQEEVHHCNEVRSDNRIENLMVMPDYKTHMDFHRNPPAWVPRCACCGHLRPELVAGRPDHVPLVYDHELCYEVEVGDPSV